MALELSRSWTVVELIVAAFIISLKVTVTFVAVLTPTAPLMGDTDASDAGTHRFSSCSTYSRAVRCGDSRPLRRRTGFDHSCRRTTGASSLGIRLDHSPKASPARRENRTRKGTFPASGWVSSGQTRRERLPPSVGRRCKEYRWVQPA